MSNRAWRTEVLGVESIVAAETRGQAVYRTLRSAVDVGYLVKWNDIRAGRAPEHDAWAVTQMESRCLDEAFVRGEEGER